jgi:riboflavin kinase/FMN adenylyltransferase
MDGLPEIPSPVVTMGSFDGVHHGHRVIIARLNMLARQCGGQSVLITFSPHPRKVLYPDTAGKDLQLISALEEKCSLLEETGLDHLVILEFTREFSLTSSMDFVKHYLHGRLGAHTIVVGFNHFFGHNKEGNFDSLYANSSRFGYRVEEIPEQEIQNETVSSTKIRKALKEGNIQRANAYLEHLYLMRSVLHIDESAKKSKGRYCLRMEIRDEHKLIPPPGAYAASYRSGQGHCKALVRIGEEGLLLFPEDPGRHTEAGLRDIHLHKFLGHAPGNLSREIATVSELIY